MRMKHRYPEISNWEQASHRADASWHARKGFRVSWNPKHGYRQQTTIELVGQEKFFTEELHAMNKTRVRYTIARLKTRESTNEKNYSGITDSINA